jgi:plasmid stability protein
MAKTIQIRNVPDSVHRKLKMKAAGEGMSLSNFLNREVRKVSERVSNGELLRRLAQQPVQHLSISPTQIVREHRDL